MRNTRRSPPRSTSPATSSSSPSAATSASRRTRGTSSRSTAGQGASSTSSTRAAATGSGLLDPTTCPVSGPGMWARAGVVVEPGSGRLLVATANGLWNGRNAWADSVLELSPDAGKLIQSYTPANQSHLGLDDLDLGSTAPAILTAHVALQGGKDGKLRLLDLDRLNGQDARAREARRRAAAPVRTEGQGSADGARRLAFGRARLGVRRHVLRHRRLPPGRRPEAAAAAGVGDGDRRLEPDRRRWPALRLQPARGLAERLQPDLRQAVAQLDAGLGHWNSPIVADGRIALPEGDANRHSSTSVLDIYRLPGR